MKARVDDLKNVIKRSKELRYARTHAHTHPLQSPLTSLHRRTSLSAIADQLDDWRTRITKEKAIYHHLNMFNYDLGRQCLIADAWCPTKRIDDVHAALRVATVRTFCTQN